MVEIDPTNPITAIVNTALGRFRHGLARRVWKKLVAYMGMTDAGDLTLSARYS